MSVSLRIKHLANALPVQIRYTHEAFSKMHPIWQIPELLVHVVSFLPIDDNHHMLTISHHFRTLLKANLPPQLRPLPDSYHKRLCIDQALFQAVKDKAKAYMSREVATPNPLRFEDSYHYWREDARSHVLAALSPCLHPVLCKYVTFLTDGYDSLAEGGTNFCLQIDIPHDSLCELVYSKHRGDRGSLLAVVPSKSVTVFCLGGASWDLLYGNVTYRSYGGVSRFSVRVEKESGVSLGDILDELMGPLVVDGMSGGLWQDVVLVGIFEDGCDG
jgi:hypothetical protein